MPTFQLLLHTSGISFGPSHDSAGELKPAIGFYWSTRIHAEDPDQAFKLAMAEFDADEDMMEIVQSGQKLGLEPKTEIEEVYKIGWLKSLLPWKVPGLMFYEDEQ